MLKWIKNSKSKGLTRKKGITYYKNDKKYRAYVSYYNNKTGKTDHLYIGFYKTIKEAEKARIKYILELL